MRQLAQARCNAWEVRRVLACRDLALCRSVSSSMQRWCLALRLPVQGGITSTAVQRARQELLLRVHPDKNAAQDAALAAEAFAFLQQAVKGLLTHSTGS